MLTKVQKVWKAALQWRILEPASKRKMSTHRRSGKCQAGSPSLAGPRADWGGRGSVATQGRHRETETRKAVSPPTAGQGATE